MAAEHVKMRECQLIESKKPQELNLEERADNHQLVNCLLELHELITADNRKQSETQNRIIHWALGWFVLSSLFLPKCYSLVSLPMLLIGLLPTNRRWDWPTLKL